MVKQYRFQAQTLEQRQSEPARSSGFFTLNCNNRKKQGRHGYRALEIEGAQFTSGRIRLDTDRLRDEEGRLVNGFESMQIMLDTLGEWGDVAVVWEDEGQKGGVE